VTQDVRAGQTVRQHAIQGAQRALIAMIAVDHHEIDVPPTASLASLSAAGE